MTYEKIKNFEKNIWFKTRSHGLFEEFNDFIKKNTTGCLTRATTPRICRLKLLIS